MLDLLDRDLWLCLKQMVNSKYFMFTFPQKKISIEMGIVENNILAFDAKVKLLSIT